ncbi:Aste57867_3166 [Aphanomyces stellatus]|uniref:Aste57867_3166 protein n=1 Tax=Aphanomyces stellatus TaxID=120398 RepID=A0A485KEW1_9STRA|nr:hypothetical protein As57867_003157 [Aphanomyces stellatus]VFT80340.1 Aste57867_3166 [Aphanomyces stellatus]
MSWVDEWRAAKIEVQLARGDTGDVHPIDTAVSLLQGEMVAIVVRVHTPAAAADPPKWAISRESWYKHRACVTSTCLLRTSDDTATVILQQSIEFHPIDEGGATDVFELRATCRVRVDPIYLDQPVSLAVHFKVDAAAGAFRHVGKSYAAIDAAVLNYAFFADSLPSACATRELTLPPPVSIIDPMHMAVDVHGDDFDPALSVVLRLSNSHPHKSLSLTDVHLHVPFDVSILEQEPPSTHGSTLAPFESFHVVWHVRRAIASVVHHAVAIVSWHLLSNGNASSCMVHQCPIVLASSPRPPPASFQADTMHVVDMGMDVSARWVPETDVVCPGAPFQAHVHVTNHTTTDMELVLLFPWRRMDNGPPSAAAGHARLLALASQWVDDRTTPSFVSLRATHVIGLVRGGCTSVVPIDGLALAHGRVRVAHAMLYDNRRDTFYRQDRAWDVIACR